MGGHDFWLENAGATYQRAMNYIFHKLISKIVEIYIDDVVVKSGSYKQHLADLRESLECARKHGLKMNPNKCAFGVSAGQFLGFMVHDRGIEISQKSIKAINDAEPPTDKTSLQSLIGKINFIQKFISNLSGRIRPFSPLLKLKADEEFVWGEEQQKAFDDIKEYLISLPVLIPPQKNKPFKLYLLTDVLPIGSVLIQEFEGKEQVVFYLSRKLVDAETMYSPVEKLCLCLYFSCTKLRHYLLSAECTIVCKTDVIKYVLSMPILKGRIRKWVLALSEFDLTYESAKAVKGQVMADFVTQHIGKEVKMVEPLPWTMFFDGSSCNQGCGIGIVIISPRGASFEFGFPIDPNSTNNQAEYQAVIMGLKLLKEIGAEVIEVFGDSQFVVNQLIGKYDCKDDALFGYREECRQLLEEFMMVNIEHIPKDQNQEANNLAQRASGYRRI